MLRQVKCFWTHLETSFAAATLLDRLANVFKDSRSCLVSYDVPADEKACKLPIWLKPDWMWAMWISTLFWKQLQKERKTKRKHPQLLTLLSSKPGILRGQSSVQWNRSITLIWCRYNFWLVFKDLTPYFPPITFKNKRNVTAILAFPALFVGCMICSLFGVTRQFVKRTLI